jgi:trans-aconitate methyltransferase
MQLYDALAPWYRLVDPPADHADEAEIYGRALAGAATPPPETLLELGAGAGHNAFYLKKRFRCTLTDISEPMLALSRELNPDCEHIRGDMRTIRLRRTFDVVFVHDAVAYMTSHADLAAAAATAFVHTRPGGAALFAPDYLRETFAETATLMQADDGGRALRGVEWAWDADPSDSAYQVEYALLLRDGRTVRAVHDRHVEGLFSGDAWLAILGAAGFTVDVIERPLGELTGCTDRIFLCRRAARSAL